MDILQAVLLGVIQGVTEFLPISSTAHLILARDFFGIGLNNSLVFDLFLHLATVVAVLVYFRKDFVEVGKTLGKLAFNHPVSQTEKTFLLSIIVGSIPALIFGFIFKDFVENNLRSPIVIAVFLILGSALFWFAEKKATQKSSVTISGSFIMGFFQALALFPGLSRSGSTISGGLLLGLTRQDAARLSFMLGFPVIAVASLYEILTFGEVIFATPVIIPSIFGFTVALGSGLYSIDFLMKFLKTRPLTAFIPYRVVLALIVVLGLLY